VRNKDGRLLQLDILKDNDIEAQIIGMQGRGFEENQGLYLVVRLN
jgi:hypothetical protein